MQIFITTLYHYLLPKKLLTQLAQYLAESKQTWLKNYLIRDFLKKYPVNMQEAQESNPYHYENFNAFFTRHLKSEVRPLDSARFVSPVDGQISETGRIHHQQILQAKGIEYRLQDLLACPLEQVQHFINGSFMTIYLSPKDYHRVHMPITGQLVQQTYVPGRLFSVQPFTTQHIPNIFSKNERLILYFNTTEGPFIIILVGATIVGCMGTTWGGDITRQAKLTTQFFKNGPCIQQGDELGYFKLGSTVIMLWPNSIHPQWKQPWKAGMELLLRQAII